VWCSELPGAITQSVFIVMAGLVLLALISKRRPP
jgi:hypothetical protein